MVVKEQSEAFEIESLRMTREQFIKQFFLWVMFWLVGVSDARLDAIWKTFSGIGDDKDGDKSNLDQTMMAEDNGDGEGAIDADSLGEAGEEMNQNAGEEDNKERYPRHENVKATVFWIGEMASDDNNFIDNLSTEWVSEAVGKFGGVDEPNQRNPENRLYPSGFTPNENPFYAALPAGEYNARGLIPGARERSPWANEKVGEGGSLFKNRWIAVENGANGKIAYVQWEDTGPFYTDKYDYVFEGVSLEDPYAPGIDLSPAAAIYLELDQGVPVDAVSGVVNWWFVDEADVPRDGPWYEIVTRSGPDWGE